MEKTGWWKLFGGYILWVGGAIIMALLIRTFVLEKVVVDGTSMLTNFQNGEQLFIEKVTYRFHNPKRYDVIVFQIPDTMDIPGVEKGEYLIKRVIGLPGETVQIKNGKVFINGEELVTDIYGMDQVIEDAGIAEEGITLGEGEYFALGDNRNGSTDSREIGTITTGIIQGRVCLRVWPFDRAKVF